MKAIFKTRKTTDRRVAGMRKGLIILAALAVFSMLSTGIALAGSDYGTFQGGYNDPTAGKSPHGGYSDTTDKCKTCHAVHNASTTGQVLLRSTVSNACVYCHVSTNFTITRVYGGDVANYDNHYDNNHASFHNNSSTFTYNGCVNCHSVHGANTIATDTATGEVLAPKILRNNPGGTILAGNTVGGVAAPADNLTDFCRDCHDGMTTEGQALYSSNGCGMCHGSTSPNFVAAIYPGAKNIKSNWSHTMTTPGGITGGTDRTYTGQVAWKASSECRSCHSGGYTDASSSTDTAVRLDTAVNNFPHYTQGVDFLSDEHTTTGSLDLVCLDCHTNTGDPATATQGVGKTY